MRVLVTTKKSPAHRYLIHIFTKSLIREVRSLIEKEKHSEALMLALSKGIIEREISADELSSVTADLILSERNASWDLMK